MRNEITVVLVIAVLLSNIIGTMTISGDASDLHDPDDSSGQDTIHNGQNEVFPVLDLDWSQIEEDNSV